MKPHTTPKDFFVNVGALIALIIGVSSLLALAFSVINHFVADLSPWFNITDYTVRWTVSMLIVIAPIYFVLNHIINKGIRLNPEKKEIWVWKWLTYLTLFLSGATLAGDLVAIVNTFLGGEISTRFALKAITVLIVAALVFFYYFASLKKDVVHFAKIAKNLFFTAIVVLVVFIVLGFVAAGSPFEARKVRLDEQRISDLSSIEYAVENYAVSYDKIPVNLDAIESDPGSFFSAPVDPRTGASYEYRPIDATSYELCATFEAESNDGTDLSLESYYRMNNKSDYEHGVGRTCFTKSFVFQN